MYRRKLAMQRLLKRKEEQEEQQRVSHKMSSASVCLILPSYRR
jgi:hypothetical protein